MVHQTLATIDFEPLSLPSLPLPKKILMTSPTYFEVKYVINTHMVGNIGSIDLSKAKQQWKSLKEAYEKLSFEVSVLEGEKGLPDMVFCANQTLPYTVKNKNGFVLSNMFNQERKREVQFYQTFFEQLGYETKALHSSTNTSLEGMGDALWHVEKKLLWGGYGFRTDLSIYQSIATELGVEIVALALHDPDFYHLDTCLCMLDRTTVMIYPGAFDEDGLGLIYHFFERIIEVPESEARNLFATNAHCPDKEHVLIQQGCKETIQKLNRAGFTPIEIDTSEFLKAGGSVFCMKLQYW